MYRHLPHEWFWYLDVAKALLRSGLKFEFLVLMGLYIRVRFGFRPSAEIEAEVSRRVDEGMKALPCLHDPQEVGRECAFAEPHPQIYLHLRPIQPVLPAFYVRCVRRERNSGRHQVRPQAWPYAGQGDPGQGSCAGGGAAPAKAGADGIYFVAGWGHHSGQWSGAADARQPHPGALWLRRLPTSGVPHPSS
jgi:hypothetical protein